MVVCIGDALAKSNEVYKDLCPFQGSSLVIVEDPESPEEKLKKCDSCSQVMKFLFLVGLSPMVDAVTYQQPKSLWEIVKFEA